MKRIWHQYVNFLVLHYVYIGILCFIVAGFFYFEPDTEWPFVDTLFMSITAVTNTGTNTIDMEEFSTYQLLLLFFASIMGSHITISLVIVLIRKHYFSKRFQDVLQYNRTQRLRERSNKRQFGKNLADLQTKMQQQQLSAPSMHHSHNTATSTTTPFRSNTMPSTNHHRQRTSGILPYFRPTSAITSASFNLHNLFKGGQTDHYNENDVGNNNNHKDEVHVKIDEKERQEIYDTLCTTGRSLHGFHQQSENISNFIPLSSLENTTSRSISLPKINNNSDNQRLEGEESSHPNIAFAVNVDSQRWEARKELLLEQQDRHRLESSPELRQKGIKRHEDEEEQQQHHEEEIDESVIWDNDLTHKHELTRKQRYSIGGAEYRAIDFLSIFIPIMYLVTTLVSSFVMRVYIAIDGYAEEALRTTNDKGPVDPWMFSFFVCFSAHNNLGLAPTSTSLMPFVNAPFPLLLVSFLIIIGNVGYPIALRFYIWCIYKLLPQSRAMDRETLRYLLDHPRRCYTTLFPATQTWWLVFVVIGISLVEWVVFLATNYWLPVLEGIPWASRIVVGLFQGVSTRNAGFTAIQILHLNPGTQVVYIMAMYLKSYPVGISIRNSNVYQERELGIYSGDLGPDHELISEQQQHALTKLRRFPTMSSVMTTSKKLIPKQPSFYVMTQIQRMVTREICWVIIGIFCICVIEAEAIMTTSSAITALTVTYEVVSAFGNSGSSTGHPETNTAQAGSYRTLSKLVLMFLMYRGRHRGLPSAIDHAVLLPSEQLDKKEEQENKLRQRHAELMSQENLLVDQPYPRWRSRAFSMA